MFFNVAGANDAANRLIVEHRDGTLAGSTAHHTTFTYDPAGNRLVQEIDGDVTTYSYDVGNRLLYEEETSGRTTYTYDADGNQTTVETPTSAVTTHLWDYENQSAGLERPNGDVVTHVYGIVNRKNDRLRVETDDEGDVTRLVYDGRNVSRELDELGTLEAEYTYQPAAYGNLLSAHANLETDFYAFDTRGNTAKVFDSAAVTTEEYSYSAYGRELSSTVSGGGSLTATNTWQGEQGYRYQRQDGIYDVRHREYGPNNGRFLSTDPAAGEERSFYKNVDDDPVNRTDPSGLTNWVIKELYNWTDTEQSGGLFCSSIEYKNRIWLDEDDTGLVRHRYTSWRYVNGKQESKAGDFTARIPEYRDVGLLKVAATLPTNRGNVAAFASPHALDVFIDKLPVETSADEKLNSINEWFADQAGIKGLKKINVAPPPPDEWGNLLGAALEYARGASCAVINKIPGLNSLCSIVEKCTSAGGALVQAGYDVFQSLVFGGRKVAKTVVKAAGLAFGGFASDAPGLLADALKKQLLPGDVNMTTFLTAIREQDWLSILDQALQAVAMTAEDLVQWMKDGAPELPQGIVDALEEGFGALREGGPGKFVSWLEEAIGDRLKQLKDLSKGVTESFQSFFDTITGDIWGTISRAIVKAIPNLLLAVAKQFAGGAVGLVLSLLSNLGEICDQLKNVFLAIGTAFKGAANGQGAEALGDIIRKTFGDLVEPVVALATKLFKPLGAVLKTAREAFSSLRKKVKTTITGMVEKAWERFKAFFQRLFGGGDYKAPPQSATVNDRTVKVWIRQDGTLVVEASPAVNWEDVPKECRDKVKTEKAAVDAAETAHDTAQKTKGKGSTKRKADAFNKLQKAVNKLAGAIAKKCGLDVCREEEDTSSPCKDFNGCALSITDRWTVTTKTVNVFVPKTLQEQPVDVVDTSTALVKKSDRRDSGSSKTTNASRAFVQRLVGLPRIVAPTDFDFAGHVIADTLGGHGSLKKPLNIFPQNETSNTEGQWPAAEDFARKTVDKYGEACIQVTLIYGDAVLKGRPDEMTYAVWFGNKLLRTFDAVNQKPGLPGA